jgi:hypothetical protein
MAKNKKSREARRERPHFNAVDAMIVILVIVAVVGVYFRYNIIDLLRADPANDEYVVAFEIENIRYTTPSYINIGDTVRFASNGETLGTLLSASENVSALNTAPSSIYVVNENGHSDQIFYPEQTRVDATGRILAVGSYSADGGFYVGGDTYISAGQKISVTTELVTVDIKLTSIEAYLGN